MIQGIAYLTLPRHRLFQLIRLIHNVLTTPFDLTLIIIIIIILIPMIPLQDYYNNHTHVSLIHAHLLVSLISMIPFLSLLKTSEATMSNLNLMLSSMT